MTIEYDENATICGYNLKELILFAEMCRRLGITEEELHDFVDFLKSVNRTPGV